MFYGEYPSIIKEGGRIHIPVKLRRELGGTEIVFVGCGDHVEIWGKKAYQKEKRQMSKVLQEVRG